MQPHAWQNFLNPWLILAGIDGEVALGDTQLGDAGSKVDGDMAPLHLKDADELGFPKLHPSCCP